MKIVLSGQEIATCWQEIRPFGARKSSFWDKKIALCGQRIGSFRARKSTALMLPRSQIALSDHKTPRFL